MKTAVPTIRAPDNIIDDADMELIGTSDPGWLAGMTNTFKYKDFDLSFHLNGMFDRIMEDPTAMEYGISGDGIARYGLNALRSVKDRWTWDNPSTTNPSTFQGWENTYSSGDFYYQKAWFIRMQNITLGYTLPKHLLAKTKVISNLRIHASVNNAFTITPYDGLDLKRIITPLHILMREHSALELISHSDIPNVKTQYYETIH